MDDLFNKRMGIIMRGGSLGARLVENSNIIENKTFSNDVNFRKGKLYDWNMNELEEVEFKFEKVKTYTAGGKEVEYMIHFKSNFSPEHKYKELYYKSDGKERLGFYIDVPDASKNKVEKWLIVGKDDRVAFDRYNAFKCNWYFEWINNNRYHKCLGVVRDKSDLSARLGDDKLGGTSIDGDLSIILPTNQRVENIELGTKFMITDNVKNPQVYEVIKIKDTSPLGTTRAYLKQCMYNSHTDIYGVINELKDYQFCFQLPIEDLPMEYGGQYHMICNCIKSKGLPEIPQQDDYSWRLVSEDKYIYINGQSVSIEAFTQISNDKCCDWHIFVDEIEYQIEELRDYFDIIINNNKMSIKAINKVMAKYIVKVAIYDKLKTYYDSIEMEVKI